MTILPGPTSSDRSVQAPSRVLVFRIGYFGDSVVAVPALWAIRAAYPAAHITLLGVHDPAGIRVSIADVLPPRGLVDEVVTYAVQAAGIRASASLAKLAWRIRRNPFDLAICLAPSLRTQRQLTRDRWMLRALAIRTVVGTEVVTAVNDPADPEGEREADFLMARVAAAGIPTPPPGQERRDLALGADEIATARAWVVAAGLDPGRGLAAIAPTAGMPSKVWPLDRIATVGRTLVDRWGLTPVIISTAADTDVVGRLVAAIGSGVGTLGQLPVRPLAALLAECRILVGNDSGPVHVAAAVGTPVVAIFSGYEGSTRWRPLGSGHIVLRHRVACEGCRAVECPLESQCLTGISVEAVIDGCRSILDSRTVASDRQVGARESRRS